MPIPGTYGDSGKKQTDDPGNTTPIAITSLSVSGISGGNATVSWTTSQPSSSWVSYGQYPNRSQRTAETDTNPLVTSHSVNLTNLTPGKTYQVRVNSRYGGGKDGQGNSVMDGYVFTADTQFVSA